MEIVEAVTAARLEHARALFEEYWQSFGFTPCFQNFGAELAALPGDYVRPGGRLALAVVEDNPAGCVALRRLDAERAEFKRLYVPPRYRGLRIGRALLAWVIAEAKNSGYQALVCDTMPVMADALAMYRRGGFEETGPYSSHPTPGAIYLRLALES